MEGGWGDSGLNRQHYLVKNLVKTMKNIRLTYPVFVKAYLTV